jgi:2-methylisocitrate lyase-like PEP mutase family enzyme
MVRAVAPKPLNVLAIDPSLSVAELADLGVRRISVGGALARVGLEAVMRAAKQLKNGSFEGLSAAAPGKMLNGANCKIAAARKNFRFEGVRRPRPESGMVLLQQTTIRIGTRPCGRC